MTKVQRQLVKAENERRRVKVKAASELEGGGGVWEKVQTEINQRISLAGRGIIS